MDDLKYNPETGEFTRAGRVLKATNATGYIYVSYQGKPVQAHRLAWFLTHGYWPNKIDHVNRVRNDNRIENLREVDAQGNAQNIPLTTVRGAHLHKPSGLYKSAIGVHGKQIHLGYFKTPGEASAAYIEAKKKYHPNWTHNE